MMQCSMAGCRPPLSLFVLLLPSVATYPVAIRASPVKSALLVVDMQGCFLPGGPLAVSGDAGPVVDTINSLKQHGGFDLVVWMQDWHPPNHASFAPAHGQQPQDSLQLSYTCVGSRWLGQGPRLCNMTYLYPSPEQAVTCVSHHPDDDSSSGSSGSADTAGQSVSKAAHGLAAAAEHLGACVRAFGCPEPVTQVQQVLWPRHCVRHTADAQLHPKLQVSMDELVVRKGWQPQVDAYSAFEDNGKLQSTGLAEQLRGAGIGRVVLTGVALEFCVLWSALDAVAEGFETMLVLDATLPVSESGGGDALQQLRRAGVQLVEKAEALHRAAAEE